MVNVGDVLQNRYRITEQLGKGGMGAVYKAWDTRLSISVALKEMLVQPGLDEALLGQLRNQFQQEAKILARLGHPNLVGVTDYFEEGHSVYLVMKYVEGESLAGRIQRQGALPEDQVITWSLQLLSALAYCHQQGIIHRDIKPQNIIIRSDGEAVLVDFGLVKLWDPNAPQTRTAVRGVGTPQYAPPEQYELDAGHTEPRSDLYSLGATMYHALTGEAPPTATMRIAMPEQFKPIRQITPDVSEMLVTAIERAMELPRARRWASAAEMATALGGSVRATANVAGPMMLSGRGGTVRMDDAALAQFRRKMPTWAWVVAPLLLLLVGAGLFFVFREKDVPAQTATVSPSTVAPSASATLGVTETLTATSADTATATWTPTVTPSPTPQATETETPTPEFTETPTETPKPVESPTPKPTPVPTTPAPTSFPQPTPLPPTAAIEPTPVPVVGSGRIIFTLQMGDSLYLYSTDPAGGGMAEIGKTDYGHSTCAGTGQASTITGQTINLYSLPRCNITERTDSCPSPDGQYKLITNFVETGWTVTLENVTSGTSEWYYNGTLNRTVGIQWAPNSRSVILGVHSTIYGITVGYSGMNAVITVMNPEWLPQFSPDGSLIYYLKPVGGEGNSDVFVVNPDGTGDRNLTNSTVARKLCPRWRR